MNPKKMKVSELRAALESRGLSSNGLKSELIQRLELALDEEEFGSAAQEAQDLEALKPPSPAKAPAPEAKKAPAAAALASPKKAAPEPAVEAAKPASPKKAAPAAESEPAPAVEEAKAEVAEAQDPASDAPADDKSESAAKTMTEEEKRAARAAKFGIPLSLEDKKVRRCGVSRCVWRGV